jgi:hypothetical protein
MKKTQISPSLNLLHNGSSAPKLKIPSAYVPDLWVCNHSNSRRTLSDNRDDKEIFQDDYSKIPSICTRQNHNGYHRSLFSSWSSQVKNNNKNSMKPLSNVKRIALVKKSLENRKRSHSYDHKLIDNFKYLMNLKNNLGKNLKMKSKTTSIVKISKNSEDFIQQNPDLLRTESKNDTSLDLVSENISRGKEMSNQHNRINDFAQIPSTHTSLKSPDSCKTQRLNELYKERNSSTKKIVRSEPTIRFNNHNAYLNDSVEISQSEPVLYDSLRILKPCLFDNEIKDTIFKKNFETLNSTQNIGSNTERLSRNKINTRNKSSLEDKKKIENDEDQKSDAIDKFKYILRLGSPEVKNKINQDTFGYDNCTEINLDKEPEIKESENDLTGFWVTSGKSKLGLKLARYSESNLLVFE